MKKDLDSSSHEPRSSRILRKGSYFLVSDDHRIIRCAAINWRGDVLRIYTFSTCLLLIFVPEPN